MSAPLPTQPGLYAKSCRFDGVSVLVLFAVSQEQVDRWRLLASEARRLGALEISLADADHPGYALAIEGQGFSECSAYAEVTGWDHRTIDRILATQGWCQVVVDAPETVLHALYHLKPDPNVFELCPLDVMRVNAHGYVQPTVEQDDDGDLAILTPQFDLEHPHDQSLPVLHVRSGLGMVVTKAAA